MKKIEIYTNETCPYCKTIKEELKKENIEFEEKSTSEFSDEYQSIAGLTATATVPVVVQGEQYLTPGRDFSNPQHLISILKTVKDSPYSESKQALERVKTLNYHTSLAFNRLDQILKQIEKNTKKEKDETL